VFNKVWDGYGTRRLEGLINQALEEGSIIQAQGKNKQNRDVWFLEVKGAENSAQNSAQNSAHATPHSE
jgi:hypothetical protein